MSSSYSKRLTTNLTQFLLRCLRKWRSLLHGKYVAFMGELRDIFTLFMHPKNQEMSLFDWTYGKTNYISWISRQIAINWCNFCIEKGINYPQNRTIALQTKSVIMGKGIMPCIKDYRSYEHKFMFYGALQMNFVFFVIVGQGQFRYFRYRRIGRISFISLSLYKD